MMEIKDPAIKLFGKTIPVAGDSDALDDSSPRLSNASSNFSADKELAEEEAMDTEPQTDHDPDESPTQDESGDPPIAQETDDDHPLKSGAESDKDSPDSHQKDDEKESNDPKNPQQKTIKKPDKILPCPRCNSMDTKFCYYNNYNINQPRHFCKSCQRYWTAGGTMRNVPVGAGRRKNKSSSSARYCHITVSEALQAARGLDVVVPNGAHHGHRPNGTVLTFGTESPLCESMVSVLNIANKKVVLNGINGITTGPRNGFKENGGDDRSSGSTVTTTSSMDEGAKRGPQDPPPMKQSFNGFPTPTTTTATTTAAAVTPQMPCFQWPYMWNPAAVPVPPFCPVPFYPAPYWNGAAAIPWNIPWVAPPPCQTSPGSNPNSPTLGKHSRDGEILENGEKGAPTVLVPKTLRIDDPDEAAKSSIWTTLGIKKEKGNPTTTNISTTTTTASKGAGAGFFNTLHSSKKVDQDKDHKKEASPALMKANPAALCRSISFQESA